MYYSVRMRAAQGGDHLAGGRHISGAERLVTVAELAATTAAMLERARTHSRGRADFIQITVEDIPPESVRRVPLLAVTTVEAGDVIAGRRAAHAALTAAGVDPAAATAAFGLLASLPDSMRGAMVLCAACGSRRDGRDARGVRVSRMDVADDRILNRRLQQLGLTNSHVREALVLSAKVAAAPAVVAELCWSDDPEYTAGYVASKAGYFRFPHLKEYGDAVGGRIFFVRPDCDLPLLIDYLERQPVLVSVPGEED